ELVSESISKKMLKQVQHDIITRNELIHLSTYPPIHFKKIAFTLAETLITIGIIGVVAALTIPGLINNYKAHRLHTQFLKSYSTIQQAFKQMEADDVSLDPSTYPTGQFYKTFMRYLNAPFDCGDTGTHSAKLYLPCYKLENGYTTFDGNKKVDDGKLDDGQIAMQDGSLLLFENYIYYLLIHVDLNGYNNLPNRWGHDLFTFQFVDGEIKPMGERGTSYTSLNKFCNTTGNEDYNGITCAYKAKNNTDYFKSVVKSFK
ncbi:type II secretion system protein, partial [bacterium]|nr:type II secretion system protein [bacterium]